jgi:hypothetical protein
MGSISKVAGKAQLFRSAVFPLGSFSARQLFRSAAFRLTAFPLGGCPPGSFTLGSFSARQLFYCPLHYRQSASGCSRGGGAAVRPSELMGCDYLSRANKSRIEALYAECGEDS